MRYFVAVAEELHFGRAAQRLGIAQPPLSRTITQLEQRLGVPLLKRTSRKVTLTEAGSVLLAEGRAILGALAAAERRTQHAATSRPSLVLAAKAGASGELLAKLLDAYAAEPGAVAVDLLLCESQPQQTLHDGQADVALLHQPFDSTAELDTEILNTEGQVAHPSHLASTRRQIPRPDSGCQFTVGPPACPLARPRRRLPRRPRRGSTQPDAALPADRAWAHHRGHARILPSQPARRPGRRAGSRRADRDDRHRLAATQPLPSTRRPSPHSHTPLSLRSPVPPTAKANVRRLPDTTATRHPC